MSWLWKGDANSPASFEKALSKLSTQITSANLALDTSRSRSRRLKALWTLYTTLTYLLYTLIITLVLGPKNWALPHYLGLVGAPLVIYGIRKLVTLFFGWRIGRQQSYLEELQKQRETKIADLKKATKYDSTQELLQKYGGGPPKQTPSKQPQQSTKRKPSSSTSPPQRTGISPPPTANIPGRNFAPQGTPQRPIIDMSPGSANRQTTISPSMLRQSPPILNPNESMFAPNAFDTIPPTNTRPAYDSAPRWYDRILDVMLGEDEMAAKNRLALVCTSCRLVNGQAPPGVKTLEEVGSWRCSSCNAWNGVESESTKAVKEMKEKSAADVGETWEKVSRGDELSDSPSPADASPDVEIKETGRQKASGRDSDNEGSATRRVTRSAQNAEPLESLE